MILDSFNLEENMDNEHTSPLVSVIIPAFNAEASISATIRSVLAQTFSDFELLVLDDCSTDRTCQVVAELAQTDSRIHLLTSTCNAGVAAVRNRGIAASRGAFIALLDSDDCWLPEKLEKQLALLRKQNATVCYTSYALVNENMERVRSDHIVPDTIDYKGLLKENLIGCSTVLADAKVLKAHPFRSDFYHEDFVLWLELLKAGERFVGCREVLSCWCYRENSRSFNKFKSFQNRWRVYRKSEKLSVFSSLYFSAYYMVAGLKKYTRRKFSGKSVDVDR